MLAAVEEAGARVGDAATLTGELYALIDDGPGRRRPARPCPATRSAGEAAAAARGRGRRAAAGRDSGVEDYEQMELPPFMTPVMEELVRPPSDAPVKREAEGAEPQPEGRARRSRPREDADADADKAMSTTEAQRGPGLARGGRPADRRSEGDEDAPPGPPTGARTTPRAAGRTPPTQTGLGDVPQVEPEAERGGPRRAGLPLRRVGPQDRGLPAGLVHAHRAPPDPHPGGLRRGDLPRVRRDRHPDPAQLPADAPRGAAQDALHGGRRRSRHRRPGRVRR